MNEQQSGQRINSTSFSLNLHFPSFSTAQQQQQQCVRSSQPQKPIIKFPLQCPQSHTDFSSIAVVPLFVGLISFLRTLSDMTFSSFSVLLKWIFYLCLIHQMANQRVSGGLTTAASEPSQISQLFSSNFSLLLFAEK